MSKMMWEKKKTQFLLRDKISGRYYCRLYANNKQHWHSLGTDSISVAKARLAAYIKEFRAATSIKQTVEQGTATVESNWLKHIWRRFIKPSISSRLRSTTGSNWLKSYLRIGRIYRRPSLKISPKPIAQRGRNDSRAGIPPPDTITPSIRCAASSKSLLTGARYTGIPPRSSESENLMVSIFSYLTERGLPRLSDLSAAKGHGARGNAEA
jgi:hypothetical protein